MRATCQYRKRLSRCHRAAIAACVFCGRTFCPEHGLHYDDESDVCLREVCQAKRQDLVAHLAWRQAAIERSNRGFCGIPECDGERWGQCSKCHALFCERHLHDSEEKVRQGFAVFTRPASMCDHCLARNKLWSRR